MAKKSPLLQCHLGEHLNKSPTTPEYIDCLGFPNCQPLMAVPPCLHPIYPGTNTDILTIEELGVCLDYFFVDPK